MAHPHRDEGPSEPDPPNNYPVHLAWDEDHVDWDPVNGLQQPPVSLEQARDDTFFQQISEDRNDPATDAAPGPPVQAEPAPTMNREPRREDNDPTTSSGLGPSARTVLAQHRSAPAIDQQDLALQAELRRYVERAVEWCRLNGLPVARHRLERTRDERLEIIRRAREQARQIEQAGAFALDFDNEELASLSFWHEMHCVQRQRRVQQQRPVQHQSMPQPDPQAQLAQDIARAVQWCSEYELPVGVPRAQRSRESQREIARRARDVERQIQQAGLSALAYNNDELASLSFWREMHNVQPQPPRGPSNVVQQPGPGTVAGPSGPNPSVPLRVNNLVPWLSGRPIISTQPTLLPSPASTWEAHDPDGPIPRCHILVWGPYIRTRENLRMEGVPSVIQKIDGEPERMELARRLVTYEHIGAGLGELTRRITGQWHNKRSTKDDDSHERTQRMLSNAKIKYRKQAKLGFPRPPVLSNVKTKTIPKSTRDILVGMSEKQLFYNTRWIVAEGGMGMYAPTAVEDRLRFWGMPRNIVYPLERPRDIPQQIKDAMRDAGIPVPDFNTFMRNWEQFMDVTHPDMGGRNYRPENHPLWLENRDMLPVPGSLRRLRIVWGAGATGPTGIFRSQRTPPPSSLPVPRIERWVTPEVVDPTPPAQPSYPSGPDNPATSPSSTTDPGLSDREVPVPLQQQFQQPARQALGLIDENEQATRQDGGREERVDKGNAGDADDVDVGMGGGVSSRPTGQPRQPIGTGMSSSGHQPAPNDGLVDSLALDEDDYVPGQAMEQILDEEENRRRQEEDSRGRQEDDDFQ
jgi:hypothetical protein